MTTTDRARRTAQSNGLGRHGWIAACAFIGFVVAGCSASSSVDPKYGVSASQRVVNAGEPVPRGGGSYKVGRPYQIAGRTYVPENDPSYDQVGLASWYGDAFHGRKTANGEIFDMYALSAAHPTLPMPTYVRVTNLENDRSVVVRVNDRGPFARNRVIDLSKRTAEVLGFTHQGTAKVRVQYVGHAPLDGEDDWLTTTVTHDGRPVDPVVVAATGVPERVARRTTRTARTRDSGSVAVIPVGFAATEATGFGSDADFQAAFASFDTPITRAERQLVGR